jgi:ribosomal protein S18 acetylase RimI-like enzyme
MNAKSPTPTRLATPADLDALAPLFDAYRQFYEQPADLPLAKAFLAQRMHRQESVILVATAPQWECSPTAATSQACSEPQGALIGFCQLYPTFCSVEAQPIYALYDLFVLPASRRSGAGQALLLAAERLAACHGKARMDLTTARTNLPAQAAYEALRWVRDEVFYSYSKAVSCASKAP